MNINFELIMELSIDLGEALVIGATPYGYRRVIPIIGGTFEGPGIKGVVLPGGADWNLQRPDGTKELWARYTLQTDDGCLISLINQGVSRGSVEEGNRYVRTTPTFEVAIGKYDWLHSSLFVGTLESDPTRRRVIPKFYKVK